MLENNNTNRKNKIKLFLDFDDTIANSSETFIDILREKGKTDKTIKDMKWDGYKSICKDITIESINEIYESKEFIERIKFIPNFLDFINKYKDLFEVIIVTKGNKDLVHKEQWLKDNLPCEFEFQGIGLQESKRIIDMSEGIFIDDSYTNLSDCNAKYKFIFKSQGETKFNQVPENSDVNIIYSWSDFENYVEFHLQKYPIFNLKEGFLND